MTWLLSFIPGVGPALAFLTSPVGRIALILVGAVALYGTGWVKGKNYQARKCNTASLERQIDELARDRDVQRDSADFVSEELRRLAQREQTANQEAANNASKRKRIPGCTVP